MVERGWIPWLARNDMERENMEKELKKEILKMVKYIDKWIDEAQGFNQKVNVKRCLDNAINGTYRIKKLLEI